MFQQQMMQMQQAGMNPQVMNAAVMNSPGMINMNNIGNNMNNMSNMNTSNPMSSMINVPPMTGNKTEGGADGQGKKNEDAGQGTNISGLKSKGQPGDSEEV